MRRLNHLTYLDLSNNQLAGTFPEWVHSLTDLELLNLGQNRFSGEIPLVIGQRLNNLRAFFKSSLGSHGKYADLRQIYSEFLTNYYPWMEHSKDLFWVDLNRSLDNRNLPETLDAYLKAEEKYLNSIIFRNFRLDQGAMSITPD